MHHATEICRSRVTKWSPYGWAVIGLLMALYAGPQGCSGADSRAAGAKEEPEAVDERDYGLILDRVRERNDEAQQMDRLRRQIELFQLELGRAPTNLAELVSTGMIDKIPDPPRGITYEYDPASGNIMQKRAVVEELDEPETSEGATDIQL